MIDMLLENVGAPLVVAAVIAIAAFLMNAKTQTTLLSQNIKSTEALSGAVNELRLQLGIFSERYVTRDELERKLKEVFHGS